MIIVISSIVCGSIVPYSIYWFIKMRIENRKDRVHNRAVRLVNKEMGYGR